ncbi:Amino acid kinase family protein [Aquisphaera giovannonii]|uniref:Amino acid kinase family protein n=1 Tax=Aquisphaera giovannonii TaxID=406548 RepID=A0A5B9W9Z4_9BACT|nr:uridylate kinase [Aquisphaera giovannonii]QEH37346.1 Amino acid kinase family protein [Aquisphaera giovannonii]
MIDPPVGEDVASWGLVGAVVVKVGGSLLGWPELPGRLAGWLDAQRASGAPSADPVLIVIAGGGPFADAVRDLDRVHGLGDEAAHRLAIRSMDLTAALLAGLLPGSRLVAGRRELLASCRLGAVLVATPGPLLRDLDDAGPDPLPSSWDVTSDSIAARIAARLGASRLVLLKSRPIADGASLREAAAIGLVDPRFPEVAAGLRRIEVVSLRDPALPPSRLRP